MAYKLITPISKNVQKTINVDFQSTDATLKTFNFSADGKFINFSVEFSNVAGEKKIEAFEVNGQEFDVLVGENVAAIIAVRESVWAYLRKNNLIGVGVDNWPL